MDTFWQHNITCATAASLIAKQCKLPVAEHLFLSGLLQNIGSLVIFQTVPELAKEIITHAQSDHKVLYEAEQRVLGFDHAEVGAALAQKWQLPASLTEIIRHHHTPSQATQFPVETAIVHLSDIIITTAGTFGHSGDKHVPPLDPTAWAQINLGQQQVPTILRQVTDKITGLTSAFTSA